MDIPDTTYRGKVQDFEHGLYGILYGKKASSSINIYDYYCYYIYIYYYNYYYYDYYYCQYDYYCDYYFDYNYEYYYYYGYLLLLYYIILL